MTTATIPLDPAARDALERRLPSVGDRLLGRLTRRDVDDPELALDLEGGELEELRIRAEGVAFGEEHNDEGPIVFVQADAEHVLLLFGQWLFDPFVVAREVPEDAWFRSFVLRRAPRSGIALSLEPLGDELVEATRLVPRRALAPLRDLGGSTETSVFRGSLDSLEQDLAAAARPVRFRKE